MSVRKVCLLVTLTVIFLLSACKSIPKELTRDEGTVWSIGITAPLYYEVDIERIWGINDSQDWTSILLPPNTHISDLDQDRKSTQAAGYEWDPYMLSPTVFYANAQQPARKITPPEEIFIAWLSLAEGKFYRLNYRLSDELQQQMLILNTKTIPEQTSFCGSKLIFGLIPGGEVSVWLSSYCESEYRFIDRVKTSGPFGVPFDLAYEEFFKGAVQRYDEKMAAQNVQLFPIPEDKLALMRNSNAKQKKLPPKPTPAPKLTHCWAEKPYNLKVKLEIGSPQHQLSRRIWNNAYDFAVKVRYLDTGIHLAWQEAEEKGFNAQQRELWVLARLSAQGQVAATQIAKGLELNSAEVKQVQSWADDFCRADSKLSSSSQNETNLE
ncbi:DUF2931 family protein [Shewanella psychropiezotolerans]|uniref:DUF2931 family protein n=1 Tax=Shewanella psychropiezotolerans TaxID=2593655 RepID=A0ABX5X2Y5_9GAMM|nr:DUF2931 family protein [Shewanella psychropiezotolerans]QDO85715.1 DUF2931 family protein [Shewanella psychropiezotolerans]